MVLTHSRLPQLIVSVLLVSAVCITSAESQGVPQRGVVEHGEPLAYRCGPRVADVVLALDELHVRPAPGVVRVPDVRSIAPQARVTPIDGSGRMLVRLSVPAADRVALELRARSFEAQGYAVEAVVYPLRGAPKGGSKPVPMQPSFLTRRLCLKLAPGVSMAEVLKRHAAVVVEKLAYLPDVYVLEATDPSLTASVDVAEALRGAGLVEFAEPQVRRQHQPRLTPNDTLFGDQWHLQNTGQVSGSTSGNDANVTSAWDTTTGASARIAVVDDSVEQTHEDLSPNVRSDLGYDFFDGDNDPSPGGVDDNHGTSVAGIAAARGNNSLGVAGAAYEAELVGVRLTAGATTDTQDAQALAYLAFAGTADRVHIYNNSWGPPDDGVTAATWGSATETAVEGGITSGRGGLGAIYVWAAGNGRQAADNVNFDGFASSRYTIAVGASGGDGVYSYYSEPGASMLVNAPSSYAGVGTTTTDRTGAPGYSSGNYTDSFGGTSSACPLAAGVVALILDTNPNLTWRDVQYVLIESAQRNDPTDGGWFQNGAGRWFNHAYGFGRVDAAAAVTTAASWSNVPASATPLSESESPGAAIPDNNSSGITRSLTVSGATDFIVEHVEVVANITHTYRGDLQVKLTSPDGTTSELATSRPGDSTSNFSNWTFTSVAHWGEDPSGTWNLNVADVQSQDTGTLNSWTLLIYGYQQATGPRLSVTPTTNNAGADAGSATFAVANAGIGSLSWSASVTSGGSWARITAGATGTAPGDITVGYDANPLTSDRTATIEVTAAGATGSPTTVSLVQSGLTPPQLSVSPALRSVSHEASQTTFNIANLGDGAINWSASTGTSWLTLQPPTSGSGDGTLTVNVASNPYPTSRTGTITVTAPGAAGSPASVSVVQSGNDNVVLSVTPATLDAASGAGNASFAVANTGEGILEWTASVTSGGSWLSIASGASGTNSGVINAQYTANTTDTERTGTITVASTGAVGSPKSLTVTQACVVPGAPGSVSASNGTFSDRIRVSWSAVSGATTYRIYRGTDADFASASIIGEWSQTSFDDYSAALGQSSSNGCGGGTQYYYWVAALNGCGTGTAAGPDGGSLGGAGAGLKRRVTTFAKAWPRVGAKGLRYLTSGDAIAIRVRADEALRPETVFARLETGRAAGESPEGTVQWLGVSSDSRDGWAVFWPEQPFAVGARFRVTAGARTVSGETVERSVGGFAVVDAQPETPAHAPVLAAALGERHELRRDAAFAGAPSEFWLPLPEEARCADVQLCYLQSGTPDAGWYGANDVQGWLEPGSLTAETRGGVPGVRFQARHGGVVQFARTRQEAPMRAGGGIVLLATGVGALALAAIRRRKGSARA